MTKQNLIDLIKHKLAGGDCPQELKGKYHDEIVSKHITLALNYLINDVIYVRANKNKDWGSLDPYAKTFLGNIIKYNEERNERYIDLPSDYIPLPKNRGIRIVSPEQGQDKPFLYRDNNTSRIYKNLDVNDVYNEVRFYVEGNKLFFSEHLPNYVETVLIKIIQPFDAMNDDDNVVVPQGYGKVVIDLVFQSMMGMPLEKASNDNNANTV